MTPFLVNRVSRLRGEISLPGDKAIAHRAIIISAISQGKTTIENFPFNKDCLSTIKSFRKLGIRIIHRNKGFSRITVFGKGLYGLTEPKSPIFVNDSGTTLRLLLGVLAGQDFKVKLSAGKSLSQRPMLRVTEPLRMMGANIKARSIARHAQGEEYPPIIIKGGSLGAITYSMPVASAQVKSAILLAGLYAEGKTRVIEPVSTRDHTERMLKLFKADIKLKENYIVINGCGKLISPRVITIPGDISSASFFIVLAATLPNSQIVIKNVSLNPGRTGIIKVLKRMGAAIRVSGLGSRVWGIEPMGDLIVKNSFLRGTVVKKEEIPALIDELPILMVAASVARGKTIFEGVAELRVKETDRIRSMSENLRKMGANIAVFKANNYLECITIKGIKELKGARVSSFSDHRTAMSMIVAGLRAKGKTSIDNISCINKSFPDFISLLKTLIP